jgi:hypothetical protein
VVRSGGEVGSSPSDRFAGYEAGVTLKRLPWDVKDCPKIEIDSDALHLRGAATATLAQFTTWWIGSTSNCEATSGLTVSQSFHSLDAALN